jgi:hypothetical protein
LELNFNFHPAQKLIYNSDARFKVVAAGRRFGKSYLAAMLMLMYGIQSTHVGVSGKTYDVTNKPIYYIGPTFEQAKRIMWDLVQTLGRPLIAKTHENSATITLVNGRKIIIKGSDDPNSLRGLGYHFVVMDEYAFMKPEVWTKIVRPALTDVEGHALFIGTPEGENHFFDLFVEAKHAGKPVWEAWQFTTLDNPTLDPGDVLSARDQLSSAEFSQEYEASFATAKGSVFNSKWWKYADRVPFDGDTYMAVDLAGFSNVGSLTRKELKVRDESAIAVVTCGQEGWYVEDIRHGQWDVRRTALELMDAYRTYRPVEVGIERGMAKNAVLPYLEDEMKRLNCFYSVIELTHGNNKKADRIKWALQGRAEKGRIFLNENGEWVNRFVRQASDFPSSLAHDDLLDAVSYIDQLANTAYINPHKFVWEQAYIPDDIIGF